MTRKSPNIVLIAVLLMLLLLQPGDVQAFESIKSGDFEFWIDGDTAAVYKYYGDDSVVSIPSTIGDVPVTAIRSMAFIFVGNMREVIIPDSITTIGYSAFSNCRSLKSVTLPDSIVSIGRQAFQSCTNLVSVYIPKNITAIEEAMFWGCESLTMTIPNHINEIKRMGFYGCESLVSVVIPDGVISIGEDAFSWCTKLTSVTIPDSVKSIGYSAFSNPQWVTIYANQGSYAHAHAIEHGYPFIPLEDRAVELPGDATNDGTIDILDLVSIIDYIVSNTDPASLTNADANGDGSVDILDLVWIIDQIVGG